MVKTAKTNYETIYRSYINELYSYGSALGIEQMLLQDIIHDVFLHLFEHKILTDPNKNIKLFLFRCLKNRFIDLKRKVGHFEDIDEGCEQTFIIKVTAIDLIEEEEERIEISNRIEQMLGILTSRQREAIYLKYMHGLEYNEISELLNISTKGVRKLIYRSIDTIRKKYGVEMSLTLIFFLQESFKLNRSI